MTHNNANGGVDDGNDVNVFFLDSDGGSESRGHKGQGEEDVGETHVCWLVWF